MIEVASGEDLKVGKILLITEHHVEFMGCRTLLLSKELRLEEILVFTTVIIQKK